MEGNTIADSGDAGLWAQRFASETGVINIDAGLGALGSEGQNRIIGSAVYDVYAYDLNVHAAANWWGSAAGPSSIEALECAVVEVDPVLLADPK